MKRKYGRDVKNDFFYAFAIFAMFAVIVFGVVAGLVERDSEAYVGQVAEARPPANAARRRAIQVARAGERK
jgi:hypothetical protein